MRISIPGALLFSLLLWGTPALGQEPAGDKDGHTPAEALDPVQVARALSTAFADVAEEVAPATVHIQVGPSSSFSTGVQQLLKDYEIPLPDSTGSGGSTGSGVVVREDGLVLTNHHVVGGSSEILVTLHDKREYSAHLLGSDPRTDIAVLQIDGPGPFVAAPLGDSDAVRVGEWVLAIGHPFDFQFSVSVGVISARGRRNLSRDEIQDFLQTDAAVNPGSSGGPLFDLNGSVIGLNTAIFNPGETATHAGIAFAIPSNMAWKVASELIHTGHVARAAIGVQSRDRPARTGHPRPGVEITLVSPHSPASRAGLQVGDVILSVDGEPITSSRELRAVVLAAGTTTDLQLEVERETQQLVIEITTEDHEQIRAGELQIPRDATLWAGLTLAPLTAERASHFGTLLDGVDPRAPIVLQVQPESPGAAAGLMPGDLILQIRGEGVDGPTAPGRLSGDLNTVAITLWRVDGSAVAIISGLE
jgi:serine protease Do